MVWDGEHCLAARCFEGLLVDGRTFWREERRNVGRGDGSPDAGSWGDLPHMLFVKDLPISQLEGVPLGFSALLGSLLQLLSRTSHLATKRLPKCFRRGPLVSLPLHGTLDARVLSYRLLRSRDQLVKLTPNLTPRGHCAFVIGIFKQVPVRVVIG